MALRFEEQLLPLATDKDGAVRVAGTRVTLDTVVQAFDQGATPEEIAQQYPSLSLADIYAVISYYLRNRSEVSDYLLARAEQAREIRRENEARYEAQGIRERLLARRAAPRR